MDLILERLEPEQERLLQVLADAYRLDHRWPSWRWVRKQLGLLADEANELLRSLPRLGERQHVIYGLVYGLAWASDPIDGMGGVNDNTTVGLTVAGLSRACVLGDPIPSSWCPAADVLRVLAAAVAVSEAFQPSRTGSELARFGSEQVAALDGGTPSLDGLDLYELLRREPPFWGLGGGCTPEGAWHYQLEDSIERFAGVKTMADYVAEVGKQIREANAKVGAFLPMPAPPVAAGAPYAASVAERGWGMTAEQVCQVRLLLWLAAQEEGLYTLEELYAGNEEAELALRDTTVLADRGLVDAQIGLARGEDLAGIKVRILPAGRADADQICNRQQNRAARHRACREALVSWLYEVDAIGPMRSRIWQDFWSDARSAYLGDGFTEQEVDRAAGWLRRNGLINGVMAHQFEGPIRAYLTDHGVRCVEDFEGDVQRYVERMEQPQPIATGHTFNVTATNVQLATGNDVRQTMTVSEASQEVLQAVQGIIEMLQGLGLVTGREAELTEVQQEAVNDITTGDAKLSGLRRFIDWAVAAAKAGASPAITAAVQTATAGLLQNAEHVVRAIGQ